jgi:phage-related protein
MEIKFFTLRSGKSPVLSFLQSLEKPDRARIFGCLKSIEEFGFDCPRVDFRQIDGKLWEIKIKTASGGFRFFYVSVMKQIIILLHAYKKQSQKAPEKEISTARSRLKEVLTHEGDYI